MELPVRACEQPDLHDAVSDLQSGKADYAVVGGSSAIFRPATSLAFYRLK